MDKIDFNTISDLGVDNQPTTLYVAFFLITFGYLMAKFAIIQKFGVTYSNKKNKWQHTPSYSTYISISYVILLVIIQILVLLFDNLQRHCKGYVSNKNIISILISSITTWGLIFSTTFFTINFLPLDWKSVFGNTVGYEISSRLYGLDKYETFFQKILNDPNDPSLKKKNAKMSKSLVDLLNTLLDKRYKNVKHFVNGMTLDKFTQFINISIYEKIIKDIPDDIANKARIPKDKEDEEGKDAKEKELSRFRDQRVSTALIDALGENAEPVKSSADAETPAPAETPATGETPAATAPAATPPASGTADTNKEDMKGGANNEINVTELGKQLQDIERKRNEPFTPELINKIRELSENIDTIERSRASKSNELLKLKQENDSFDDDINNLRLRIKELNTNNEENIKKERLLDESNKDILSEDQEFEEDLDQDILSEESELYNLISKLYKVIALKDLFGEFIWISLAGMLTILITYTKVLEEKCYPKADSVFGNINKLLQAVGLNSDPTYDKTKRDAEAQAAAYKASIEETQKENRAGTKQFKEIDSRFTKDNPENFALLKEDSNFNNTRTFNKKIQDNTFWKATKDPSSLELGEFDKNKTMDEVNNIKKRMRTQGVPFLTQQLNI